MKKRLLAAAVLAVAACSDISGHDEAVQAAARCAEFPRQVARQLGASQPPNPGIYGERMVLLNPAFVTVSKDGMCEDAVFKSTETLHLVLTNTTAYARVNHEGRWYGFVFLAHREGKWHFALSDATAIASDMDVPAQSLGDLDLLEPEELEENLQRLERPVPS